MNSLTKYYSILKRIESGKSFLVNQLIFNYNFSRFEAERSIDSMIRYASTIEENITSQIDPKNEYVSSVLIRTPENYPISNGFWMFCASLLVNCDIHWILPGQSNELVKWFQSQILDIYDKNEIQFYSEQNKSIISELSNFEPELFTFVGSSRRFKEIKTSNFLSKVNLIGETGGYNIAVCGEKSNYKRLIEKICLQIYRHWGQNCNTIRAIYVPDTYYPELLNCIKNGLKQDYSKIAPKAFVNKNYAKNYSKFIENAEVYCKNIITIDYPVKLLEVDPAYALNLLNEEWIGPAIAIIPYSGNNEIHNTLKQIEVFSFSFWGEFQSGFISELLLENNYPMHTFNSLVSSNPNTLWYGGNKTGEGFLLGKQFIQQFRKKRNGNNDEIEKVLSEEIIPFEMG